MSYTFITIPDGFDSKKSYIKSMAIVEAHNGLGAPWHVISFLLLATTN
jgi:hypothetical protein